MCKKLSFLVITALLSSAAMHAMETKAATVVTSTPAVTTTPVVQAPVVAPTPVATVVAQESIKVTPTTCTTNCKIKQVCGAWLEKAKSAATIAKEKVGTFASTAKEKTYTFASNAKTKVGECSRNVMQAAKNTTPKQRLIIGGVVVGTAVAAYCIYRYFKKPTKEESKE